MEIDTMIIRAETWTQATKLHALNQDMDKILRSPSGKASPGFGAPGTKNKQPRSHVSPLAAS